MEASVRIERWPIEGGFRIARGSRQAAELVLLELHSEGLVGRAESVPYARYGESSESVRGLIETCCRQLGDGLSRATVHAAVPAGAARNALDCALWDLECRHRGTPAWRLAGLDSAPGPVRTMRTLSLGSAEQMAAAASRVSGAPMLKLKVDGQRALKKIEAVHEVAPEASLLVDANESWSPAQLEQWLPELPALGVRVLEQPLAAGADEALADLRGPVLFCADESFHDRGSFESMGQRYDMVNVKLDKTGGLSEALRCAQEARARGLQVMVGCMVCTSLGVEPALLLAQHAEHVDLDGPLLLARDRPGAKHRAERSLLLPCPSLWGGG